MLSLAHDLLAFIYSVRCSAKGGHGAARWLCPSTEHNQDNLFTGMSTDQPEKDTPRQSQLTVSAETLSYRYLS